MGNSLLTNFMNSICCKAVSPTRVLYSPVKCGGWKKSLSHSRNHSFPTSIYLGSYPISDRSSLTSVYLINHITCSFLQSLSLYQRLWVYTWLFCFCRFLDKLVLYSSLPLTTTNFYLDMSCAFFVESFSIKAIDVIFLMQSSSISPVISLLWTST